MKMKSPVDSKQGFSLTNLLQCYFAASRFSLASGTFQIRNLPQANRLPAGDRRQRSRISELEPFESKISGVISINVIRQN